MEQPAGTPANAGWSYTKVAVVSVIVGSLIGLSYVGYKKWFKKADPAAPGEAEAPSESSGTSESAIPGNTGIAGGGIKGKSKTTTTTVTTQTKTAKGGGGKATTAKPSGGGGFAGRGSGSGTEKTSSLPVRTDFDKVWNYQKRDGVWFTARKATPNNWISLEKNESASGRLDAKYPNG